MLNVGWQFLERLLMCSFRLHLEQQSQCMAVAWDSMLPWGASAAHQEDSNIEACCDIKCYVSYIYMG